MTSYKYIGTAGLATMVLLAACSSDHLLASPAEEAAADAPIVRPVEKARTAYGALPRNTQSFDGVTFEVQKPINIIGARAGKAKGGALARFSDPKVHGQGQYIHVLHTGDHGSSKTGEHVWRLVLHYADGARERFDFAYDVHLRNYWRRAGDGPPKPSDPNTSLAWVGTSLESDKQAADLIVSRTTLENPLPIIDVVGAEFVSLFGQSSAYVLAVTICSEGPKPVPVDMLSATNVVPVTLIFQNDAGQPQPKVSLNCKFECDGYTVKLAPQVTDEKGEITLDVPIDVITAIQYGAQLPNGTAAPGQMKVSSTEKELAIRFIRLK